jgi:hypothetical protein
MAWTIVRTPVRGQTHQDAGEFDRADDATAKRWPTKSAKTIYMAKHQHTAVVGKRAKDGQTGSI